MSIKVKINNDWVDTNIKAVRGVNHVNSEDVYTKQESDTLFSGKVSKTDIVQNTGTSTTSVMSQKAVSDALSKKADLTNSQQTIRADVTWTNDIYLGDEAYKISFNNNGDLTYNGDKVMVGTTVSNEVSLVQNTGQSTTSVMSQKAVSDELGAIDEVINGKQKTTITTEFTERYQFVALATPIPAGTTITNVSGQTVGLYDNITSKRQIGGNLSVGSTITISENVGAIRSLTNTNTSVIEYGEEVAGLSDKVNEAIASAENASGSVQTLNTKLYGKDETIVSVTFSNTITQVKLDTPITAGTKIYSDGKTISYRDIDKNELAFEAEDTIVSTNKDIHYVSIYPTPTATKVVNIHFIDAVKGEVEDIAIAQDKDYVIVDKSDEFTRLGSVNHNDGTFVSSGVDFIRTPYLYVGDVESVLTTLPNINTSAGMAFYDNEHTFINANIKNTQSNRWIMIPEGAVYMMTACYADVQPLLLLKKRATKESKSIVENLAMRSNAELPSRSHLIYDYKDFVLDDGSPATPRVSLTGSSRVMLNTNDRLQDKKFVAHIRIQDDKTTVVFGNDDASLSNADDYINTIEVRINGGKFQVWKVTGTPTMLTEDTLSFSLNAGDVISVGYERFDKIEGSNYSKATYFIKSGENSFEKEFEYRNDMKAGGVMYSSIAGLMGKAYVGISSGSADLLNYYIVSSNNPKAKVLIFGDSFTGGNTLSNGEIHKRYCSLIKARIGDKDCVIAGKGGEEINAYSLEPMKRLASKYLPKYMIIELGENNANLIGYTTAMDNILSYLKQIGVEPILMTVNAFGNKATGATDTRRSLRLSMEEYIKSKGCLYVDMFNACCIDENGVARYKDGYGLPDLIHPSVLGHQAIYEAFCNEVPEIFE